MFLILLIPLHLRKGHHIFEVLLILQIRVEDTVAHAQWFQGALFAMVFVVDMVAMFFFYSLVRRWRAKTLWKNSYLCRIFRCVKASSAG